MVKKLKTHNSLNESNIKAFFDQWNIYKKIISGNYMFHNEIIEVMINYFNNNFHTPFSLMDLGCGDAYVPSNILVGSKANHYFGIDLSKIALEYAVKNISDIKIEKKFIVGDYLEIINDIKYKFDIIIIGYSMHHLLYGNKKTLINKCYHKLNEQGVLIIYDVCRGNNESREEYISRYFKNCELEWVSLNEHEMESLKDHILENDYPEPIKTHINISEEAGFESSDLLFIDKSKLHFLLSIYK